MQHDLACGCFLAIHARNGPVEWAQFTSASCCFEPHPGASSRVLRPSRQKSPRPASFRPSAALSRERTTNQELLLLIAQRTPATGPRAALCRGSVRENRLLIEATEATSRGCGSKVGPIPSRLRANPEESAPPRRDFWCERLRHAKEPPKA